MVGIVKEQIRIAVDEIDTPGYWYQQLPYICQAHNRTKQIYGFSPEEIMFGLKLRDINENNKVIKDWNEHQRQFRSNLEKLHKIMTEDKLKKREQQRNSKNKAREAKSFNPGDLVMYRNLEITDKSAMTSKFTGPYIIQNINDSGHTANIQDLNNGTVRKAHFTHLLKLTTNLKNSRINQNWDKELRTLKFK